MAARARVRDVIGIRHRWRDEPKRMAANVHIRDGLLNPGHMTGNALVACGTCGVVRMFLNRTSMRAVRGARPVALQAHDIRRFDQQGIVFGAVNIVATGALHTASVHQALHEIVSLHAVFVCCPVRKVSKGSFSKLVLFQAPVILELLAHMKPDWPVVVFAVDRIV